jgi:hypothetical protein
MSGFYKAIPMHERAIDWAIAQGYYLSVRDYYEEEFDVRHSQDRKEVIDACEATELPNVYIGRRQNRLDPNDIFYDSVAVFSVIDEGIPDETICDYVPATGEFNDWFDAELDRRVA